MSLVYEALLLFAVWFVSGFGYLLMARALPLALPRVVFQLFLLVIAGVYFVYQWVHGGQTLPMKTWRLKLVSQDGTRITVLQGIVRYATAVLTYALLGIGYLWGLVDRDGAFLHDRIARTRLIDVADE